MCIIVCCTHMRCICQLTKAVSQLRGNHSQLMGMLRGWGMQGGHTQYQYELKACHPGLLHSTRGRLTGLRR